MLSDTVRYKEIAGMEKSGGLLATVDAYHSLQPLCVSPQWISGSLQWMICSL